MNWAMAALAVGCVLVFCYVVIEATRRLDAPYEPRPESGREEAPLPPKQEGG